MPAQASTATAHPTRQLPRPLTADELAVLERYRKAREAAALMHRPGKGQMVFVRVTFDHAGNPDEVDGRVTDGKAGAW